MAPYAGGGAATDGEDRIMVRMPIVDNESEGIWARVSTLDAGDSRGEIADSV